MHFSTLLRAFLGATFRRTGAVPPVLVFTIAAIAIASASTQAQQLQIRINGAVQRPRGEVNSIAGVYLPTDRATSRAVSRAKDRLANGEYHEALTFLQGILSRNEDSFLENATDEVEQQGLKTTARRLIGGLPPDGLDAYERLYGATARRQLDSALKSGDPAELAKVVRQYFHTAAGYEAALVLAQVESDLGHRLAATGWYDALLASPRAAAKFEPQLSTLAALNHLTAGRPTEGAKTLRTLLERQPATEITLSGKTVTAPGSGSDLSAWLSQQVGTSVNQARLDLQWLTARGDATRNVEVPGGRPHLRPRWQARVVNEPAVERYLENRADEFARRGVVAVPAAKPLAVGDFVLMRTPQNVVASDWQTGKRVWETRDDREFETEESLGELVESMDPDQSAAASKPVEERIWEDVLSMSLASDGRRVFVLRGGELRQDEMMNGTIFPGLGRVVGEPAASTNQLVAYDLRTEGKLLWEVDGGRAQPPLDGAFFLGAPLAIDDTLFVMAEQRSAIYLFALDPATGRVRWQQQLVGLELGIDMDPLRRQVGSSPSYWGGILVCPTGAGAVVAIDVVKREFAWVYRYPRDMTTIDARNVWQAQPPQPARINDRWLDSSVIVADGRVVLSPPESGELHCLDLQTGKTLWKQPKGNSVLVGGVLEGRVLLIGPDSVRALKLADGAAAWDQESVSLPAGSLPAGHGYLSAGRYFLPLTTGEIAAIEMTTGKLESVVAPQDDVALGNLIFHRDTIVSQSPLLLDKFEQLEALQQRAQSAVQGNPDDATALVELAELKRADGDVLEAVKLLKRAHELAPDNPLAREMLAETLLEAIAGDYAGFQSDLPLVASLIQDRAQQLELARIEAAGLEKLGQHLEAWDAYLRLSDFTAEEPTLLDIGKGYTVRSDRWIAGRLVALWSAANEDHRRAMAAKLESRRPVLENLRTAADLRHYLVHFGQLPGALDVRKALVRFLISRERLSEAELELLEISASQDPNSQAAVAELIALLPAKSDSNAGNSAAGWPSGKVEVKVTRNESVLSDRARREHSDPQQRERQSGVRQLRFEQELGLAPRTMQWMVALDCSEVVGRNMVGDDLFRLAFDQSNWPHNFRDSNAAHAARIGNLLFVAIGGQVVAIDARQNSGTGLTHSAIDSFPGLLWRTESVDRRAVHSMRHRRGLISKPAVANSRPVYHAWSSRRRITGAVGPSTRSLGPTTQRGVVYQEQNELKCVEPLSGETLWTRTDVPAGCELFGDEELIFAADSNARVAHVIRVIDGELVETRPLPPHELLVTAGRNVAELGFRNAREGRNLHVRVSDMWDQDTLFEAEYPLASRVSVVEPNAVAVYQPSGKFQLVDVRNGRTIIDQQLQTVPNAQAINTIVDGDELYLFITGPVQPKQHTPIGQPDYPLINGVVYALNRNSGEPLWPSPAVVRNRGIVLSQPPGIPLLVFADQKMTRDPMTGGGSQLRILCLDKRTGAAIYRNNELPSTPATRFGISFERGVRQRTADGDVRFSKESTPTVALEISGGKIELTMTDRPRPPQPPANDDLEAPSAITERGLRAIGQRITGALRGKLERDPDAAPLPADQPHEPQTPQEEGDDD